MAIKIEDRVYKSKAGFFDVWRLTGSFGIYNNSGVKLIEVKGTTPRAQRMAELAADSLEGEFQW